MARQRESAAAPYCFRRFSAGCYAAFKYADVYAICESLFDTPPLVTCQLFDAAPRRHADVADYYAAAATLLLFHVAYAYLLTLPPR